MTKSANERKETLPLSSVGGHFALNDQGRGDLVAKVRLPGPRDTLTRAATLAVTAHIQLELKEEQILGS